MYKKGQTSIHLTDEDDGNQPLPHINSAFDNPAGWWIFCVTWSQLGKGLTSSRKTSSLPPSPHLSLYIFPQIIGTMKWTAWWNHSNGGTELWLGAAASQSSDPVRRACVSTEAQTLQLIGSIKQWIYPPVISAVASLHLLSFLVPTQFLCTFVVNKSQNVRGEGLQQCRKRTSCWEKFGNLYSTITGTKETVSQ